MTIRMGRKAWEQIRAGQAESVTKSIGEQVIVDLSMKDYEIRRESKGTK